MTTLALWLLISGGNSTRPPFYAPFATQQACENALQVMRNDSGFGPGYHCVETGAKPQERAETESSVKPYRE